MPIWLEAILGLLAITLRRSVLARGCAGRLGE